MWKAHFILLYVVKHVAESSVSSLIYQQINFGLRQSLRCEKKKGSGDWSLEKKNGKNFSHKDSSLHLTLYLLLLKAI